jgi:hypothetical protein
MASMTYEQKKEWLANLRVGDQVILSGRRKRIEQVTKTTPAQFLVGEQRF